MKFEFSAGGIVVKHEKHKDYILVCQHSQHHGWVFPKGLIDSYPHPNPLPKGEGERVRGTRAHPEDGTKTNKKETKSAFAKGFSETKEEAALREVKEETGITGKILKELPPVTYWYVLKGKKIKKTVYYFLMDFVSGDITDHDHEMEAVEWLPIEEVEKRLTYKSDKEVWNKAKLLLNLKRKVKN